MWRSCWGGGRASIAPPPKTLSLVLGFSMSSLLGCQAARVAFCHATLGLGFTLLFFPISRVSSGVCNVALGLCHLGFPQFRVSPTQPVHTRAGVHPITNSSLHLPPILGHLLPCSPSPLLIAPTFGLITFACHLSPLLHPVSFPYARIATLFCYLIACPFLQLSTTHSWENYYNIASNWQA